MKENYTIADCFNAGACIEGVARFVTENGLCISAPVEDLADSVSELERFSVGLDGDGYGYGDGDGYGYGDGYGDGDGYGYGYGDGDGDGDRDGNGDGYGDLYGEEDEA